MRHPHAQPTVFTMSIQPDLSSSIGHVPMLRLRHASALTGCEILGKAEFLNPGGSIKDRTALGLVLDAERRGALRPGGRIVVAGATSGSQPPADLSRVFFLQLSVIGSTMGTREELGQLISLCQVTGIRPLIDHVYPLADAAEALRQVASGDLFGKIVLRV